MTFDMQEYHQFVELLYKHPEWRAQLRQLVLTEELLGLPEIVRRLAEAYERAEERLARLETIVAELAEAQKRNEAQLEILTQRVNELAEAQKRTEETLAALSQRVDYIDMRLTKVEQRLAKVDGRTLELEYERKVIGYFGQILRRPQVVKLIELEEDVGSLLLDEEWLELSRTDLLVRGYLRWPLGENPRPEAYLAVEASVLVDREDLERAQRRANLLRRAGLLALPVAAGEDVTERALQAAKQQGVILVIDGSTRFVEEALKQFTAGN
ncbi:MAG: hypothetical protein RML93_12055 [Anaerolineales bacterium]|nr:hypothetical protein [Anaerolineales bacterium]MDW8448007.1 hypothetical protein [Anaerolineales bacterium]